MTSPQRDPSDFPAGCNALPLGARVQAAAREAVGLRAHHASPLWTLQRLCFEPDVAAGISDRGENRDPGQQRKRKRSLTTEARLENGSLLARVFVTMQLVGCGHVFGLFVRFT